ncbi:MAG: dockerin type I repeat-containing protein, partial [Clostridia bacterium]|nr:dockerin type I repeat-containing protein [Clostridia bacterium]
LELQGALADIDAELSPAELFANLAVKPIIKLGDNELTEVNENGIYKLTPDISDEAVVCGNYALKLIISDNEEDKYCDLIVNGESTDVITLKDDSNYEFIAKVEENGGYYRFTYAEMGWTHGVDDVSKVDRYVLGQISPKTSVNAFLNNIKSNKSVRVYSKDGKLLYDRGNPGEGITSEDLGKWSRIRVTTGSYVELMKDNNAVERVYLSILGDVNGDGYVTAADTVKISAFIQKQIAPEQTEVILAALVENNGRISAADVAQLNRVIALKVKIERFFYDPDNSGDDDGDEEEPTMD